MNCKFASIDGSNCLVNFKTNDGRVAMVVQKMCEDVEVIEVKRIQVSDLDAGTLIMNDSICLQMPAEFIALPLAASGVRTTGPSRLRLVRDRRREAFCELWSPRFPCQPRMHAGCMRPLP